MIPSSTIRAAPSESAGSSVDIPVLDFELELAWLVICGQSKFRNADVNPVLRYFRDRRACRNAGRLLELPSVWKCLADATGTRFVQRQHDVFVAGIPHPAAADVSFLLRSAQRELRSYPKASSVRLGLGGLAHLLIHPLADGNGRSARMIWACALLDYNFGARSTYLIVRDLVYSRQPDLVSLIQSAGWADEKLFFDRWEQLVETHRPEK